jgi:hypothetical protein
MEDGNVGKNMSPSMFGKIQMLREMSSLMLLPALFAQYIHTKLLIMFVPHGSLVQIRFWHV